MILVSDEWDLHLVDIDPEICRSPTAWRGSHRAQGRADQAHCHARPPPCTFVMVLELERIEEALGVGDDVIHRRKLRQDLGIFGEKRSDFPPQPRSCRTPGPSARSLPRASCEPRDSSCGTGLPRRWWDRSNHHTLHPTSSWITTAMDSSLAWLAVLFAKALGLS